VPESDTDCGLPLALSAMVREATLVPVAEGVNNIAIVQLPPATTEGLQVLASVKLLALVPVSARLETLKAELPVLFRVMV
jgi:hypothetical protein